MVPQNQTLDLYTAITSFFLPSPKTAQLSTDDGTGCHETILPLIKKLFDNRAELAVPRHLSTHRTAGVGSLVESLSEIVETCLDCK